MELYDVVDIEANTGCWKRFQALLYKNTKSRVFSVNKPLFSFVKCRICDKVYGHNSKDGTTTLNRHKCRDGKTDEAISSSNTLQPASLIEKQIIGKKITIMCIKDSRPYEMASGDGFAEYTQAVIDIAQNSTHRLDARTLIPHPTTISRNTHDIKELCVNQLKSKLFEMEVDSVGMAFTLDIWTDGTNKVI